MGECIEKLPGRRSFLLCLSLKAGSYVAAAVGMIHPAVFVAPFAKEKLNVWLTNVAGVLAAVLFICSILLLVGILTGSRPLVMIYVYFGIMFLLCMLSILFIVAIQNISKGKFWMRSGICFLIVWYLLLFYLVLVVNSYANKLLEDKLEARCEDALYKCAETETQPKC